MSELGYFLSSEELGPRDAGRELAMGEAAGFRSILVSDHFHPWTDRQGESPFVWSVSARSPPRRSCGDDRGDVPDRAPPSCGRGAGGGDRLPVAGRTVPVRRRQR